MTEPLKVLHFINQFFAGQGGEEHANTELSVVAGPVGPGRRLEALLGNGAQIVTTLVAGDNWVTENPEIASTAIKDAINAASPDVVIAGPTFNAGRYGLASGAVCVIAQSLGIPAVTSMFEENPGVLAHRADIVIVPCAEEVKGMEEALGSMARLALKLGSGEELGPAAEDGYFPRDIRREGERYASAATRSGDMLVARLTGKPWTTELRIDIPDVATPAQPIADLSKASIAIMTAGGVVPKGNPKGQARGGSTSWWLYDIGKLSTLAPEDWESIHRGFYVGVTNENPNYAAPLDVMREIEDAGGVRLVHDEMLSVSGVGTHVSDSRRLGKEMAQHLKDNKIDGALLVAT